MAGAVFADVEAARAAGYRLGQVLRAGDLVILTGPLGAGKTTFTQGIGDGMGVRGPVTSPTFVIARVHPSLVGGPELLHVDAYRLDSAAQLWDLDLDTEGAVTVVEWGKGKAEELASDWLEVTIERPTGTEQLPTGTEQLPTGSEQLPTGLEQQAAGVGLQAAGVGQMSDAEDQPRTVTWQSRGERWAEVDLDAVFSGPWR